MTFTLAQKAATQPEARADLGIGRDDVVRNGDRLDVTVHSLGAVATPPATLRLETADGASVASVPIPVMAAPVDLSPRVVPVRLTRAGEGAVAAGDRYRGRGGTDHAQQCRRAGRRAMMRGWRGLVLALAAFAPLASAQAHGEVWRFDTLARIGGMVPTCLATRILNAAPMAKPWCSTGRKTR
jgi:hypothetical protein